MSRILVIDDEEVVRTAIRTMLEMAGYEVEEAYDGEEGIEKYRQNPFDVVIVDIFFSELEVIRKLKKDFPEIKIIAISGMGAREELDIVSIANQYGATYAFAKPFNAGQILGVVRELLAK